MRAAARLLVVSLLVAAGAARAESPAAEKNARAREAFHQGMLHYNVGEYKEALESFKQAYFAKPDPVFLFNMGQAYRQLHDPEGAAREYRAYLRERPNAPNRADVEKFIQAADEEIQRRSAMVPPTGILPSHEAPTPAVQEEPTAATLTTTEAPPPVEEKKRPIWPWLVGGGAVLVAAVVTIAVIFLVPSNASPATSSDGVVRFP